MLERLSPYVLAHGALEMVPPEASKPSEPFFNQRTFAPFADKGKPWTKREAGTGRIRSAS